MRDYNGNGEVDKEDYILHEQMIEEQEKIARCFGDRTSERNNYNLNP